MLGRYVSKAQDPPSRGTVPRRNSDLHQDSPQRHTTYHTNKETTKMTRVPSTIEVLQGARVNVVLKADQPTGHTVQGVVSQLLTKGNHPRGIKVRLTDGRVGRVQSMAGEAGSPGLQVQPPEGNWETTAAVGLAEPVTGWRRQYRDARLDQEQPASAQTIGLDAYIKPAKKRGKAKVTDRATTGTVTDHSRPGSSGLLTDQASHDPDESSCPVCGDFRGDTMALTHHVQSHFDD